MQTARVDRVPKSLRHGGGTEIPKARTLQWLVHLPSAKEGAGHDAQALGSSIQVLIPGLRVWPEFSPICYTV